MYLGPEDTKPQGNSEWLSTYKLALTDTVSCDTVDCKRPATHYAQVKCCNAVIIGCEKCLHGAFKVVIWMIKTGQPIKCQGCSEVCNPNGWLSRPQEL